MDFKELSVCFLSQQTPALLKRIVKTTLAYLIQKTGENCIKNNSLP
jgi:hypothetical protein